MLDCQSKHSLPILNMGITVSMCTRYMQSVNDDICSSCKERNGAGKPVLQLDFPKRSEEEIASVYAICKACPLFRPADKLCKLLKRVGHPTDVYAQNPSNHCPKGYW